MLRASAALTTALDGHVAEVGDLALEVVAERAASLRHTMTSGWMPRLRSSVTECWVGLVFCSPDGPMNGTSVTWT